MIEAYTEEELREAELKAFNAGHAAARKSAYEFFVKMHEDAVPSSTGGKTLKLYVIFAQRVCSYEGQFAPEALAIADEYTQADSPQYLYGKLGEAQASGEFVSAEIFEIVLPDSAAQRIQAKLNGMESLTGDLGNVFGPS